jgi:hypothetical protein
VKKKDGMDRRLFVQGSAVVGALGFLGGSLPIFGGEGRGRLENADPSKVKFSIDEQTQLPDGQELVATTLIPDPRGGTASFRMFLRNIEMEPNFTLISQWVLTTPSGKVSSSLSVFSGTKGPIEDGYRAMKVSSVTINPDGTITRQGPKSSRGSVTNPYEGMAPQEMFEQMFKDRLSGKFPATKERK